MRLAVFTQVNLFISCESVAAVLTTNNYTAAISPQSMLCNLDCSVHLQTMFTLSLEL